MQRSQLQRAAGMALMRRPAAPDGPSLPAAGNDSAVQITFLGNATLLLDDGETQLLTDGFLTRPSALKTLFGRVQSDSVIVESCLRRAKVTRLAVVFSLHSHYDHLLDAPTVALQTGAQLLGSSSTVMVGRGSGVPENRMTAVSAGQSYSFGKFTMTPFVSAHVPPERLTGTIDRPIAVPARVTSYRMAECYSLLIEHGSQSLLIQGSAGAVSGALDHLEVDVVYLAVGALGKQSSDYRRRYWNDVVIAVGARRVLPVHWDDFSKPLTEKLVPLPYLLDNLDQTLTFIDERAAETGIDIRIPQAWVAVDPFLRL